jgi:predicted enzyme related to lactoylglutathione lyase
MATNVIAPGTPSWVDLGTPDIAASKAFYGALFGWTGHTAEQPEAGGYTLFHNADGKEVAGAAPLQNPGQPPAWTTYIAVVDADATTKAATDAGGKVLMPPMDVMDQGRMAILEDPTGAVVAVWQAGAHKGADVFNVPGALSWNELSTRDVPAATRFYTTVFGWGAKTSEGPPAYTEWQIDGRSVGGMMAMSEEMPASVPANWLVYFAVADCQATVDSAVALGGQVRMPPMTIPQGTFAVLSDPQGATFAVIALGSA